MCIIIVIKDLINVGLGQSRRHLALYFFFILSFYHLFVFRLHAMLIQHTYIHSYVDILRLMEE